MFKLLDRACAVVLGLGAAVGHTLGSLATYGHQPTTLLWALNTSVLGLLLGGLHLLRSTRPGDRVLAWVLVPATLAWIASCVTFGLLIGAPFDPRVVIFVAASLGLLAFTLCAAIQPRGVTGAVGAAA